MYFDNDSMCIWERHKLPLDWESRLLAHVPTGPTAPIVTAMQNLVIRYGERSILIWQVQELALSICGFKRPRFHAAYDSVATKLTNIDGSPWPLEIPLDEHLRGKHPATQLTNFLGSCDGEWRALMHLINAGWLPLKRKRDGRPDWLVRKDGRDLAVEVKTKMPLASSTGRLTRYFIGLSMLPRFEFLQELDFSWYVDDDTTDSMVNNFIELFFEHFNVIESRAREGHPSMMTLDCAMETRLCVRGVRSFSLVMTRDECINEMWKHICVMFLASPRRFADTVFTGGGRARTSLGADDELPRLGVSFERLLRKKQSAKRDDETLVLMVWHMPFSAFCYEPAQIDEFWRSWCTDHGVVRGALLPVTPAGNLQPLVLTEAARLDLSDVDR
jgi:hypothetical protein